MRVPRVFERGGWISIIASHRHLVHTCNNICSSNHSPCDSLQDRKQKNHWDHCSDWQWGNNLLHQPPHGKENEVVFGKTLTIHVYLECWWNQQFQRNDPSPSQTPSQDQWKEYNTKLLHIKPQKVKQHHPWISLVDVTFSLFHPYLFPYDSSPLTLHFVILLPSYSSYFALTHLCWLTLYNPKLDLLNLWASPCQNPQNHLSRWHLLVSASSETPFVTLRLALKSVLNPTWAKCNSWQRITHRSTGLPKRSTWLGCPSLTTMNQKWLNNNIFYDTSEQ